jgi:hypothetical protein
MVDSRDIVEIKSDDKTVREILRAGTYFIPRYQRPYSWEDDQIRDFWEDVVQDNEGVYFIGPMVVYPQSAETFGVVDGQQRLTTIAMLLAILRDRFSSLDDKDLADGTHGLLERRDEDNKARFIIETETSHPFLAAQILARSKGKIGDEAGSEEKALKAAYDRLAEYVDRALDSAFSDELTKESQRAAAAKARLEEIREKVLDLSVILIQVGHEHDAQRIFVTLNARGLDLTTADLIKTHVLEKLPSNSRRTDQPMLRWDGLITVLDESSVNADDFLLASWQSRVEYVGKKKLYDQVRREVRGVTATTQTRADVYLDWLEEDAPLYVRCLDPRQYDWTRADREVERSLVFLAEHRIAQPAPLLLGLLRVRESGGLSRKLLKQALRAVEHFHFAFTVVASKTSSGGMSRLYARFGRELLEAARDSNEMSKKVRDLRSELRGRMPTEAEFIEGFTQIWMTDGSSKQRATVRYVLRNLYLAETSADNPIDFTKMSIEHLCPQSTEDAALLKVVGSMGNLMLVEERLNGKIGNKDLPSKLKALREEKAFVPPEVTFAKDWGASDIEERTRSMARLGYEKVWTL